MPRNCEKFLKDIMKNRSHYEKLNLVSKGPCTFLTDDGKPKDVDDLTVDELLNLSYNNQTMNTIMTGLST